MKPAPTETVYECTGLGLLCHAVTGTRALCPFLQLPGWQQGKITRHLPRACPTLLHLALLEVENNASLRSTFYGFLGQVKVQIRGVKADHEVQSSHL